MTLSAQFDGGKAVAQGLEGVSATENRAMMLLVVRGLLESGFSTPA